jgi:serine/threonine-protein kinase
MLGAGTQIGAYTVDGVIGHGGMGIVYRASQPELTRMVAVKLLSAQLSHDERFRERFRREATLQASLEHPNIVPVYEASEFEHGLYIAMRLVPGPNLQQVIRAQDLTPTRAVTVLAGVASALDYAHARGVVHRDVKPANILVVDDHAYLADFGLTKAVGVESITKAGPLVGTLDYVAPELIRGEEATASSDVYSLGAVLYECLTGTVPFQRTTEAAVMYAHLEQEPPSARTLRSELPAAIDDVIRQAMAKNPAERQSTAGQVTDQAAIALGETPRRTPSTPRTSTSAATAALEQVPATRPPHGQRRPLRRETRLALACAAALLVLGGFAFGLWGQSASSAVPVGATIKANGATIRVPRDWMPQSASPVRPIPDLFYYGRPGRVPVAGAVSPGHTDAGVLIGRVAAFDPNLLPGPIGRYASLNNSATAVRLNHLKALYHTGVSNDRRRSIELYLVPTSNNVVGVVCYGPLGKPNGGALERCGQIAATLRLIDSHAFALGARPQYKSRLETALGGLAARLPTLAHTLFVAPTSKAQSAAALRLAAAYALSAKEMTAVRLGGISPAEGGINIVIRDSLRGVSRAFEGLARAAARHDAAAYALALTDVRSSIDQLGASLDELSKLGYTVT